MPLSVSAYGPTVEFSLRAGRDVFEQEGPVNYKNTSSTTWGSPKPSVFPKREGIPWSFDIFKAPFPETFLSPVLPV